MKFGKSLSDVIELTNPEWGQYWINYKFLKKKINEIVEFQGGNKFLMDSAITEQHKVLAKSTVEVEFFKLLRSELKKISDFFLKAEQEYKIRWDRISESYKILMENSHNNGSDKTIWTRLLSACAKLYQDSLLLEVFAIMNYCGFSKILKKHDKMTGFNTRDAFMKNIVNSQNFTHYPIVYEIIIKSENLFRSIQAMESVLPLQEEERIFIDAIRGLKQQANILQAEEKQDSDSFNPEPTSNQKYDTDNEEPKYQTQNEPLSIASEVMLNLANASSHAGSLAVKLNTTRSSPKLNLIYDLMKKTTVKCSKPEGTVMHLSSSVEAEILNENPSKRQRLLNTEVL